MIRLSDRTGTLLVRLIRSTLDDLLAPKSVWYRILGVELVWQRSSAAIRDHPVLVVEMETNSRTCLAGQLYSFGSCEYRGHNLLYLEGAIRGMLGASEATGILAEARVVFDIAEVGFGPESPYRMLHVDDAVACGLLDAESTLMGMLRDHGITYVQQAGRFLSGPSAVLLMVLAEEIRRSGASSVLDLYAGSLGLSRAALQLGVNHVVAVDEFFTQEALWNLGGHRSKCRIVETDVDHFVPNQRFDIVVLDPFQDLTRCVLHTVGPRIRGNSDCMLVNLGHFWGRQWTSLLVRDLEALGWQVRLRELGDERVAVCSRE